MNKKLLTLAVAAAMVSPLAVQAAGTGPTVYGVMQVAVENVDSDNAAREDAWQVNSRQSRWGIKGSEDLGNGLSAVYKIEFQVDLDGNSGLTNGTDRAAGESDRNQYVGLSHKDYGTLLLGRHDSPIKMLTIGRDQFNTKLGDWNEVQGQSGVDTMEGPGANRYNDAILYKSPKFNGFEAVAMITPGNDDTKANDADGISDGLTSIGGRYVNGPIYAALAWEERDFGNNDEEESWRALINYDIAGFRLGAMYHDQEDVNFNATGDDAETWQLSASYKFGNNVVKAMYQEGDQDVSGGSDLEYEAFAVGAEHHFSKRTHVYAIYMETDEETSGGGGDDVDAFSLGLQHKF